MIAVAIAVALVALGFVIASRAYLARRRRLAPTVAILKSYEGVRRASPRVARRPQRAPYVALASELAKVHHEPEPDDERPTHDLSGDS